MTPSEQVRAKFQRAHEHAAAMVGHIAEFFKGSPYEVYDEEEPQSGDLVTRVRITDCPPIALSLALGDAVHNARAALDHLVWQLVLANGGTPDKRTCFPTAGSAKQYKAARDGLRGASPQVFDLVTNTIKPYKGGDGRFWTLHELDIEDKHHAIVPVGSAHQGVNFHITVTPPWSEDTPIEMPPLAIKPADRQYPLVDGLEVFRVHKDARTPDEMFSMRFSYTFDLCFSSDSSPAGDPLTPTIPDLISEIESAVEPLMVLLK